MSHDLRDDLDLVEPVQETAREIKPPLPVVVTSNSEAERAAARARGESVVRAPTLQRTFRGDGDEATDTSATAAVHVDSDASSALGGAAFSSGPPSPRWTQPFCESPWLGTYTFDASALPERVGHGWLRASDDRPSAPVTGRVSWIAKRT